MKKFIAVIAAVASVAASTSIANASGTNAPGGATAAANFNSVFTGSVAGTCSLTVTDGTLPANQGFVSSLTTVAGSEGKIATVCNTTTSKLDVSLAAGTAPTTQTGYVQQYSLTSGTGAYAATNIPFTAAATTVNNLSNGFSSTPSEVLVSAKGSVPTTQVLQAGTYTINVTATVTP